MPKRPPKRWMRSCIEQVEETGDVRDPGAVCGSTWYEKMSESDRKKVLREEEGKKRKHKK